MCTRSPDLDLIQASEEAKTCSSALNAERNDDAVWEALMEKAIEIASDYDIDPSWPRTTGRQQHHNNVPADTPSAYWKRAMYLPFLDDLVTDIDEKPLVPQASRLSSLSQVNDIALATRILWIMFI